MHVLIECGIYLLYMMWAIHTTCFISSLTIALVSNIKKLIFVSAFPLWFCTQCRSDFLFFCPFQASEVITSDSHRVVNTVFQKETLFPFSSVLFISILTSIALDFTAYLAIYTCAFNAALSLRSCQNFYMPVFKVGWMKISNKKYILQ